MMNVKVKEKELSLRTMFVKQSELTRIVKKTHKIIEFDPDKQKGAIICELWETANELKSEGFKEWTVKQRTTEVLEETVDILHFYLQIGNALDVPFEHFWIEKHPTIMKQFLAINTTLLSIDGPLTWALSFAQYRGLVDMLGFDWEIDIVPAYDLKYIENIERQKKGY
jgi:dimeric dUTPase (all-alpha-NTP-PPase superfamily)